MSNRLDYYFRQRVTADELDLGFAELEQAEQNLAADLGFTGVIANAVVSQNSPVADLTVDISGPGAILDQLGQRIFFSALQNVDVSKDNNGVSTAVSAAGKEKIVSVFVMFDRTLSDPRVDGNSLTVFFRRDESFKFIVVQGTEAPAGGASPPQLRSDAILLADITRRFNQSQVLAGDISIARRQDAFVLTGSPHSIRGGRTSDAVSALLGFFNAHVSGTADRHPATVIDYAGGGNWADSTTNPATTVEGGLDNIITALAGSNGALKIGASALTGSPNSLSAGSAQTQLNALLGFVNTHINQATGAHAASAISYAAGPNWKDGTSNTAPNVQAQLDGLVNALTADAGAARIGAQARTTWLGGRTNPTGVSVFAAIDKIITDLAAQTANDDGAARIGAQATAKLSAGSVRTQLDSIANTAVRTDVANTFTAAQTFNAANTFNAAQTFNGAGGDTNAALLTTAAPTTRKLLWEISGGPGNYNFRLYSSTTAFEITLNARWDGTRWNKDVTGILSTQLQLNNSTFVVRSDVAPVASPFPDSAWSNNSKFGANSQFLDATGNWHAAGATETYIGWQGFTAVATQDCGAGAPFRKVFPATPSSGVSTVVDNVNFIGSPSFFALTEVGMGASMTCNQPNFNSQFMLRVFAQ